uniref:hypothetical protein n=1 Tax=Cellvibrio fontiphilus TaxID=1815559 RepID=UPI002B4BDF0F|nr:hypothetical protein [Cellvibrio fontiphilus]
MPFSLSETLANLGNSNHIECFLVHYEQSIEANLEYEKSLSEAPNYYAWLICSSEHVYYKIRELVYTNTGDEDAFDFPYKQLLNEFFKHDLNLQEKECVIKVAKIRHLIVHKGFPNPHSSPSNRNNFIADGVSFTNDEVFKLANEIASPSSFRNLKNIHEIVMSAIKAHEKPFLRDFGGIKVIKKSTP